MKKLNLYKHCVVRDNVMIEIEKKDIKDNEALLYIGSTPTTPPDVEFIFGYKREGDFGWVNGEFSYELGYLYEEHSKNKLIEMSKQSNIHFLYLVKKLFYKLKKKHLVLIM